MPRPPDFSVKTVRLLAERAGQRCSNPQCGSPTSGPSDDGSGDSSTLGRACHITGARPSGPRYDPTLTDPQRAHADNGIWLCAVCADRIDKRENEAEFPVELLRVWKQFHESATGTDHASVENRRRYPLRQLTVVDFAGMRGESTILFGALTLFHGTMKLSYSMSELLSIFADQRQFEITSQPGDGSSSEYDRFPVTDDREMLITVEHEHRTFTKRGALKLLRSDGQEFLITIENSGAFLSMGAMPIPVFRPLLHIINPGNCFVGYDESKTGGAEDKLASQFGISVGELRRCIEEVPPDMSVFRYDYRFEDYLKVRTPKERKFQTVGSLSSGQQSRLLLDVAVKVATFRARVESIVLLVNQARILMDPQGWACLLEWLEDKKPPFQTVVDLHMAPLAGHLNRALCYEVKGEDMEVTGFALNTWSLFRQ